MTPERWRRICSILDQARALDEGDREILIQKECAADDDLRKEVESLLIAGANDARSLYFPTQSSFAEARPDRIGEYKILSRIGRGGMGEVYCGWQESLKRKVAIKVIRPELLKFGESRERFVREVMTIAKLQHSSIVPIYSVGEHDGCPYFVMEHIDGCSLETLLQALAHMNPKEIRGEDIVKMMFKLTGNESSTPHDATSLFHGMLEDVSLRIMELLADAVSHVHRCGVLHRDIKPSNIMLTPYGRVLLIDFGIARLEEAETITAPDRQVYSLHYTPPERIREGLAAADERGDIYSLGAVLYRMLTLRHPFDGSGNSDATRSTDSEGVRTPRVWNPSISRETETVCLTALQSDPKKRYQSVADFHEALVNIREGRPLTTRGKTVWARWRRRLTTRGSVAAFSTLALILVGIGYVIYFGDPSPSPSQSGRTMSAVWRLWNYDPSRSDVLSESRTGAWRTVNESHQLVVMNDGNVLDWVPSDGTWWLWRYSPDSGDVLPAPFKAKSKRAWTVVGAGHQLITMPDGKVLDWMPEFATWKIWNYDPTKENVLPGPHSVRSGKWDFMLPRPSSRPDSNISEVHELIVMPDGKILDWVPDTGMWTLWNYYKRGSEIDILVKPAAKVCERPWDDIRTNHSLVVMSDGSVLDYHTVDGSWRLFKYDPAQPDILCRPAYRSGKILNPDPQTLLNTNLSPSTLVHRLIRMPDGKILDWMVRAR